MGARSVGAHAEQDAPGIAMDDFDIVHPDAETFGNDLGKGGLVPLAVTVRTR